MEGVAYSESGGRPGLSHADNAHQFFNNLSVHDPQTSVPRSEGEVDSASRGLSLGDSRGPLNVDEVGVKSRVGGT